jgi:hypothetical protein
MSMYKKNALSIFSSVILVAMAMTGCKKDYLNRNPTDLVSQDSVFSTTASAKGALEGIHRLMYADDGTEQFGQKAIDLMADLLGEDMPISNTGAGWYVGTYNYQNVASAGGTPSYTWGFYYNIINNANLIIANIDKAQGTQAARDNIKGQALFYRAFAYYNLSVYYQQTYAGVGNNLGGTTPGTNYKDNPDVPLYTAPTITGNARAKVSEVYDQIYKDLNDAISLLGGAPSVGDKSEINVNIAQGLYARVALVKQDYQKAIDMAQAARIGYPYMSKGDCLAGFNSANNPEWMWASFQNNEQLGNAYNTFLSHMVYAAGGYSALGCQKIFYRILADNMSTTDVRNGWYFKPNEAPGLVPYSQKKFKQGSPGNFSSASLWMRSGEMALIEAEADANLNKLADAKTVLEGFIQTRDDAFTIPVTNKADMIQAILLQRRIELWGEGFRFGDIKRQMAYDVSILSASNRGLNRSTSSATAAPPLDGKHVAFLAGQTKIPIFSTRFNFKIPSSELNNNPLVTQNP